MGQTYIPDAEAKKQTHYLAGGTHGKIRLEKPRRWEISITIALRETNCEVARWMWNCLRVAFNCGLYD
jgi:hypothetical protein